MLQKEYDIIPSKANIAIFYITFQNKAIVACNCAFILAPCTSKTPTVFSSKLMLCVDLFASASVQRKQFPFLVWRCSTVHPLILSPLIPEPLARLFEGRQDIERPRTPTVYLKSLRKNHCGQMTATAQCSAQ